MKKLTYILILLFSLTTFSQQKAIEITNIKTGKVKLFEENKRIKIRTLDGKKRVGLLHFSDKQSFIINNEIIKMDSLQSIKIQPKSLGTVKTIVLVAGLSVVGSSLVAASKGNNSAFKLLTIGSGITIGAGLIEGMYSNYSTRKWQFKIIEK